MEPSGALVCGLDILQNLPVLLMYVCIIVFHRFLLNTYAVIIKKKLQRRLCQVSCYFWSMGALYVASQLISTVLVCVKPDVLVLDDGWASQFLKYKSVVVIALSVCFNTAISVVVLPELHREVGFHKITVYALIMCLLFELIELFRIYISWTETELKQDNQKGFNLILILYFACCEILIFLFVIVEVSL